MNPIERESKPKGWKTKICRFWQRNTCIYDDSCKYAHRKEDLTKQSKLPVINIVSKLKQK